MKTLPLFGVGTESLSEVISKQRRVNCYIEVRTDGNKSKLIARGTPGLDIYTTLPNVPIRGMKNVNGSLYVVAGNTLYLIDDGNGYISCGSFGSPVSTTPVIMDNNETQLGISDGNGFYIFPLTNIQTIPSVVLQEAINNISALTAITALTGN